jgi:hypothetical protein
MGAICAVNKCRRERGHGAGFEQRDVRLVEGIARTLADAFLARDNSTRLLPRRMINEALAAPSQ